MSNERPARVSVVTPFYNTAEYLEQCIESVLAQAYGDFEYILLDNQSTDGSSEIAARFADRDSRIRFLQSDTFVAQLPNYNRALTRISPESRYVKIVQADDWIYPNCLSLMVGVAEEKPRVGIVSSYRLKGTKLDGDGLPPDREIFSGRELCRIQLLDWKFFFGSPTTVMFRADVVRSRTPFFTETSRHADTEACYEILKDWDFGFVHQVLTYSRVREGSILKGLEALDPLHLLDKLIVLEKYGAAFLSDDEFETLRKEVHKRYYGFLGRQVFRFRGADFWSGHRTWLASVNLKLQRIRLLNHALKEALVALLPSHLHPSH